MPVLVHWVKAAKRLVCTTCPNIALDSSSDKKPRPMSIRNSVDGAVGMANMRNVLGHRFRFHFSIGDQNYQGKA